MLERKLLNRDLVLTLIVCFVHFFDALSVLQIDYFAVRIVYIQTKMRVGHSNRIHDFLRLFSTRTRFLARPYI